MGDLTFVQKIAVWALPILFAITVHEAAHGWVAKKLGDKTAMMLGRVTLNPLKHIDPVGTVLLPLVALWLSGFVFGWAKPVPVTWENLKNPKRDMAFVALAGPMANIIMALMWGLVLKIALSLGPELHWLGTHRLACNGFLGENSGPTGHIFTERHLCFVCVSVRCRKKAS